METDSDRTPISLRPRDNFDGHLFARSRAAVDHPQHLDRPKERKKVQLPST